MALQPKIIACGKSKAVFAMGVKFLIGPAVMVAAALIVGLRGTLLHVAIVQVTLTHQQDCYAHDSFLLETTIVFVIDR